MCLLHSREHCSTPVPMWVPMWYLVLLRFQHNAKALLHFQCHTITLCILSFAPAIEMTQKYSILNVIVWFSVREKHKTHHIRIQNQYVKWCILWNWICLTHKCRTVCGMVCLLDACTMHVFSWWNFQAVFDLMLVFYYCWWFCLDPSSIPTLPFFAGVRRFYV